MRFPEIIEKKRNGQELTRQEIEYWIKGYVKEMIPDYQTAALLMAIYFQGLSEKETVDLTEAMVNSGGRVDLSFIKGIKADKHSTGGVGDKTTLVYGPLAASAGIKIAKMSGRGLGHTGGTLDKLESIPGFCVNLSLEEFRSNVDKVGLAVVGQTANLVPADKKLYALRDVTATVESIPLIASSIMSKKLAAGADIIVLDVKYGSGAFMKEAERAKELAQIMVKIGHGMGKKVAAVISNMDRPLGKAIGNALEVKEAVETMKGKGPADITELCLYLAGETFYLAGLVHRISDGFSLAQEMLESKAALKKFADFVQAQGGNPEVVDNETVLPQADYRLTVQAPDNGYVNKIEAHYLGVAALRLGAGRSIKDEVIDPAVGIVCHKKTGDRVQKGDTLAMIHANREDGLEEARQMVLKSYSIENVFRKTEPLIYGIVTADGFDRINLNN